MQIHQINCQYISEEDRIFMKINRADNLEHEFILTRRYLKLLLNVFTEYFKKSPSTTTTVQTPTAKKAITEFEHQQAVKKSDFSKAYKPSKKANIPLLLFKLQVKYEPNHHLKLGLYSKKNQGIEMVLTPDMVHLIYHLLEKALRSADWDLDLPLGVPENEFPQGNKTLH